MIHHPINKSNHEKTKRKRKRLCCLLLLGFLILSFTMAPTAATPAYYFENDMRYMLWITRPSTSFEKRINNDARISKEVNGILVQGMQQDPLQDPLFCTLPFANIDKGNSPLKYRTTLSQLLDLDFEPAGMDSRAQRLQDIAFFGFLAYPAEQRTMDHYVSTQIMIWENLGYTLVPYSKRTGPPTPGYPRDKALIEQRISDWAAGASFQNAELELAPGERAVLKDEGYFLEVFMPLAGFTAGEEKTVAPGLCLRWNGGDELTLRAEETFTEGQTLSFSSGDKESAVGWYSDKFQSVMQPGKKPETRKLCFSVRSVPQKGSLEIIKTAPVIASWIAEPLENGDTLFHPLMRVQSQKGAVFALFDPAQPDNELFRLETDETGKARLEDIPLGRYLLREIAVPPGYLPAEEQQIELSFSAQEKNADLHLDIENRRVEFRMDLFKDFYSEREYPDEELCSKTVFGLRNKEVIPAEDGNLPAGSLIAIARPQGISRSLLLSSPVPDGDVMPEPALMRRFNLSFQIPFDVPCVLEELSAHPDFEKAGTIEINPDEGWIREDGLRQLVVEKGILNRAKRWQIRLIKKGMDEQGNLQKLAGAHFSLWREDLCVAEGVSDENGVCLLDVPDPGPWYLREDESPEGYLPFVGEKEILLDREVECLDLELFNEQEPEPTIETKTEPFQATPPPQEESAAPPLPPPIQPTIPSESRPLTLLPGAFEPAKPRMPAHTLPKTGAKDALLPAAFSILFGVLIRKRRFWS